MKTLDEFMIDYKLKEISSYLYGLNFARQKCIDGYYVQNNIGIRMMKQPDENYTLFVKRKDQPEFPYIDNLVWMDIEEIKSRINDIIFHELV